MFIRPYFNVLFVTLLCISSVSKAEDNFVLEQTADGIYVHRGIHEDLDEGYHGDICNISFVVGEKGIAVIDTGGSLNVGNKFLAQIRQISKLPILYVINTHVHPDHIFGNAAFVSPDTKFVGHEHLAAAMEKRKDSYMRINQQWLKNDFAGSQMVKPDIAVHDTLTLDLGNRVLTLQARATAHTNTDLTIFDETSKTLWTGDLLFIQRTPSIDGDIKGWIKVNQSLLEIPATQVISGHGKLSQNQTWQQAMQIEQQYLNTLLDDVRASIRKSVPMEKAMGSAAISEREHWALFDIINRRNVNMIYPALEWE
jgi:quinoprotein relay system zinc metallohydrolase 2